MSSANRHGLISFLFVSDVVEYDEGEAWFGSGSNSQTVNASHLVQVSFGLFGSYFSSCLQFRVTSVFHLPNLTLVNTWIIGRLRNYVEGDDVMK
ncbi:hypothetical protein Hanom_Chr10g00912831 [Helianthus anomalus]